ncbi:hypothetical protein D1BOALGB6SA_1481 [Olavius sp. associated proteobacterium Delta 1]|nr:hypothetical protein D1BOALGB6SA_1481 [Olavius sp. associated proteobacterium Delta 1]
MGSAKQKTDIRKEIMLYRIQFIFISFVLIFFCSNELFATISGFICKDWHEIDVDQKQEIESTSNSMLEMLLSNEGNKLWNLTHPATQKAITKPAYITSVENVHNRLSGINNAKLADGRLISVVGHKSSPGQVICGSVDQNSPEHLRIVTFPSMKKIVATITEIPSQPIGRVVSLMMAEHNSRLKLVHFMITSRSYHGKLAEYYEKIANNWISKGEIISGYLAYAMDYRLNYLGPNIQTGKFINARERLTNLLKDKELKNSLKSWTLPDGKYQIFGIDLIETLNDISPRVRYLSMKKLGADTTPIEATALMTYFKEKCPELGKEFDAVLFEAYSEIPSDPNKNYQTYRVPLSFN